MLGKTIHFLRQYLKHSEDLLRMQTARATELQGYEELCLHQTTKQSGNKYYSARKKGENKIFYLGGENDPEVSKIKEAHYLQKSIPALKKNISLIRRLVNGYTKVDYQSINDLLPEIYKNTQGVDLQTDNAKARKWKEQQEAYKATFDPWHPEQLKVRTNDNTLVRSKSEALIYNLLLSLGVTFVYERPLKTKNKFFLPDFTLLSEIDYETEIIIEHFGMMSKEGYRTKNIGKITDYMREGYTPGINLFFTFELFDGGLDLSPIMDIISMHIRP